MLRKPSNALATTLFIKTKGDFTYSPDGKKDKWKIHKEKGAFSGDCDDFALTFAYRLFSKSFWLPLLLGKFEIYHVDYNSVGHMIVLYNKVWYDNIMPLPTEVGFLPYNYGNFKKLNPFVMFVNYFFWKR